MGALGKQVHDVRNQMGSAAVDNIMFVGASRKRSRDMTEGPAGLPSLTARPGDGDAWQSDMLQKIADGKVPAIEPTDAPRNTVRKAFTAMQGGSIILGLTKETYDRLNVPENMRARAT